MTRMARFAAVLQHGALMGLLFLLPFSIAAIEIGFGVLLLGWVVQRAHPTRWQEGLWARSDLRLVGGALVLFLAVCALSVTVSGYPGLSLRGLVSKWLEYLVLFVIVADLVWTTPNLVTRALPVMACSAGFVVFESVAQEVWGYGPLRGLSLATYSRMRGPYTNPIDLATYLMVVLPLLFVSLSRWGRFGRWAGGGLFVAMVGCLVRTQALGAWMGAGVAFVILAIIDPKLRRAILVMGGVTVVVALAYLHWKGALARTFSWDDPNLLDRWHMWQAAMRMIADRPWLGHGLNTFMANYLTYWVGGEQQPRYAHNCYLQMAAETGLVGLTAFLAVLGALLWQGVRRLRSAIPSNLLLVAGLLGGLIGFLVQAGVDTNFYVVRQAALFWTLAGLMVGWSARLRSDASRA